MRLTHIRRSACSEAFSEQRTHSSLSRCAASKGCGEVVHIPHKRLSSSGEAACGTQNPVAEETALIAPLCSSPVSIPHSIHTMLSGGADYPCDIQVCELSDLLLLRKLFFIQLLPSGKKSPAPWPGWQSRGRSKISSVSISSHSSEAGLPSPCISSRTKPRGNAVD